MLRHFMETHWEYDMPMYLSFLDLENAFDRVGETGASPPLFS